MPPDPEVEVVLPRAVKLRETFRSLDDVNLVDHFSRRPVVMKSVPKFLTGPFRNSLRAALDEATVVRCFSASKVCDEKAATARNRRRGRFVDDLERRANRARQMVHSGELSSARQAQESGEIAFGTNATLQVLTDENKPPAIPREVVPQDVIEFVPAVEFNLEDDLFFKSLRSARRGVVCGPSGMTHKHLRPLLNSRSDLMNVSPEPTCHSPSSMRFAWEWLTSVEETGWRSQRHCGDVFRRLVAWTIAKQLGEEGESATSLFQCALSTRAGCECVAHVLQGLCELEPTTTITSIDSISAFDFVSILGLHRLEIAFCHTSACSTAIDQAIGVSTQHVWQFRGSSALANGCSHFWMTSTWCPLLIESEPSIPFCNGSFSRT